MKTQYGLFGFLVICFVVVASLTAPKSANSKGLKVQTYVSFDTDSNNEILGWWDLRGGYHAWSCGTNPGIQTFYDANGHVNACSQETINAYYY